MFKISVDTKNKFLIYNLVKKHFSLSKKSLAIFKNRLIYERLIPKEFSFMKKSKDLRIFKEIEHENMHLFDEGWNIFKNYFNNAEEKFTYGEYKSNIKVYNKNNYKIQKYILKRLLESPEYFVSLIVNFKRVEEGLPNTLNILKDPEYFWNETGEHKTNFKDIDFSYIYNIYMPDDDRIKLSFRKKEFSSLPIVSFYIDKKDIYKYIDIDLFKKKIEKIYERIGRNKMPNTGMFLVASLNFADWFLCSTSESWDSCLNLESEHQGAFYLGIPGLIGDKSRIMFYLTNGTEKEYRGIKSYKMIARTWGILDLKDRRTSLNIIRPYPSDMNLPEIITSNFAKEFEGTNIYPCKNINKSRYSFEALYFSIKKHYLKLMCNIYNDRCSVSIEKRNTEKKGERVRYVNGCGISDILIHDGDIKHGDFEFFNTEDGLSGIIEHDSTASDYFNDYGFEDYENYDENYDEDEEAI